MVDNSPLHEACLRYGTVEQARQLLECGQGKKYLDVKNDLEYTPLHYAGSNDQSGQIVELLIQYGANIEARDETDWTPLIFASFHRNPTAALVLLRHGANIKARDKYGETALHDFINPFRLAKTKSQKPFWTLSYEFDHRIAVVIIIGIGKSTKPRHEYPRRRWQVGIG